MSGITELFAQMLEMRGKVLYEGIALILGELPNGRAVKRWQRWLGCVENSISGPSSLTARLFAHPLIDTLSQPGSKPSYISPSHFSFALVLVFSGDGSWASLRQRLDDRRTPLGQLLGPMLDQSQGDMDKFKSLVESHFSLVMDRAGGWYKRRTQAVTFVLAFALAIGLNVNTVYIAANLQSSPELVAELVNSAETLSTASSDLAKSSFQEKPATLNEIESLRSKAKALEKQLTDFRKMKLPMGWKPAIADYSIGKFLDPWAWAGWFLTALAATLGAPFWFDTISKLFAIRGAGRKPDDASIPAVSFPAPQIQIALPPVTLHAEPGNGFPE
ncbi:MAG: hypothetical protein ACU83P_01520 [Gammaproteobacteria bacterium]